MMSETVTTETKRLENTSKEKKREKYARKLAFTCIVQAKQVKGHPPFWKCCQKTFHVAVDIHKHIAQSHSSDIDNKFGEILALPADSSKDLKKKGVFKKVDKPKQILEMSSMEKDLPCCFAENDNFPWLPHVDNLSEDPLTTDGRVVLYYKYRPITNTEHVHAWQRELCNRLQLTGKIRIATEGINATVGGSTEATQMYLESMLAHPLFQDMSLDDFKTSRGSCHDFPNGAKVGIFQEICPLGIPVNELSYKECGSHLTPEEFHEAVERHLATRDDNTLFIDCRNFYESRIGKFDGAIAPNLRKFSYWPEYVDKNIESLKGKNVYMYCTGGIRCERGSAYLKAKGVCKDVFQLEGGIHKYMEKFPDGHFRGKLFVFDDRYTIHSNDDIIASCSYCEAPCDQYQPCSSRHCHQLVLSCDTCRSNGNTACCTMCQEHGDKGLTKEECTCTMNRHRVDLLSGV